MDEPNDKKNKKSQLHPGHTPRRPAKSRISAPSRPAVTPSSTKFLNRSDQYAFRRLFFLGAIVFCILAVSVTALMKPAVLKAPLQKITDILNRKQSQLDSRKQNDLILRQVTKDGNCKVLTSHGVKSIEAAHERPLSLSIAMAECFLLSGQNFQAYSMMTPFLDELEGLSESQVNNLKQEDNRSIALIILTLALINQFKLKMARAIVGNYCTSWELSATCVAKLLVLAVSKNQAPFANDAYKILLKSIGANNKTQNQARRELTFFAHIAGARAASNISRSNVINRRFFYALNALPKNKHTLLKFLYYEWALALFTNQHLQPIPGLVDRAMTSTRGQDHNWSYKLSALKLLAQTRSKVTALKALFSSSETILIFSSDYRLVRILTALGIQNAYAKKALPILEHTYRKYMDYEPDPIFLYEMQLLKARTLIASERLLEASEFLEKSWDTNIHAYAYKHLNGVALLLGAKKRVHLQRAKAYFDLSIKDQLNWQSLYGKAKASIQLQQYREAEKILKNLRRLQVSQQKERNFWADMLKAELLLIAKKPKALLKLINKRFKWQYEHLDVLALKASAYYLLGDVEKASRTKEKADLQKVNFTRFHFWNPSAPLHPLVFHKAEQGF
ncbi:MAG: hypothetical protein HRU09_15025 [Oligoflexales bacterium]|nr:hypothetical protein [Oligoflexales bacterium]